MVKSWYWCNVKFYVLIATLPISTILYLALTIWVTYNQQKYHQYDLSLGHYQEDQYLSFEMCWISQISKALFIVHVKTALFKEVRIENEVIVKTSISTVSLEWVSIFMFGLNLGQLIFSITTRLGASVIPAEDISQDHNWQTWDSNYIVSKVSW